MSKKPNQEFWLSGLTNNAVYMYYYERLLSLSMSMFEWKNLPETVDARFLELALFADGVSIFFKEEDLGYLSLRAIIAGPLNIYAIPTRRRPYSVGGITFDDYDESNSVLIFNNEQHTNNMLAVRKYATQLYDIDRAIEINVKAQKTPILLTCEETQRLTLKNLYMQYDGNIPFIFGSKEIRPDTIKSISTGAPYIADQLQVLKTQLWNEALTYLGISNSNTTKKERMITSEVNTTLGGVIASRYSRLNARRQACEKINKMFDLEIWCDFREDYQDIAGPDEIEGEPNSEGISQTEGDDNE